MPRSRREKPDVSSEAPIDIAVRLLELQQRVAAFGSLYDEEITGLTEELTRLKADFVRQYRSQVSGGAGAASATRTKRSSGRAESSKASRKTSEEPPARNSGQPSDGSSAKKE